MHMFLIVFLFAVTKREYIVYADIIPHARCVALPYAQELLRTLR